MSRSTALALVGLALLMTPLTAHAECVEVTPTYAMAERSTELVFSGRVVETTRTAELGYRATFDVDRVWKGSVPKRFEVYVWELSGEVPLQQEFPRGRYTVVLARRLTDPKMRAGAGLAGTDKVAFTTAMCSGGLAPAKFERDLGSGYPPTSDGAARPQPSAVNRRADDCGKPRTDIEELVQHRIETELSQIPPRWKLETLAHSSRQNHRLLELTRGAVRARLLVVHLLTREDAAKYLQCLLAVYPMPKYRAVPGLGDEGYVEAATNLFFRVDTVVFDVDSGSLEIDHEIARRLVLAVKGR